MLESFGRGFRMIGASIKMGWQDKRLLLPSVLTVFTNLFFGILVFLAGAKTVQNQAPTHHLLKHNAYNLLETTPTHHLLSGHSGWAGLLDPNNFGFIGQMLGSETAIIGYCLVVLWWLTNRFLEGVTTGLVYSHLTEGPGTGRFAEAVMAVFSSLPAIIILGFVTFIAKFIAGSLRGKRNSGALGFGFNFLAGLVEIFWTLAGHLILPAIVIEGTSFWGGLKRADKIAQGNLLTIGVGEVGVDAICRLATWLVYIGGVGGFGYAYYTGILTSGITILGAFAWASTVIIVTAMSIYIRAAFYTCLYAWAIQSEAVHVSQRATVRPPAPLAAALA